MTIENIRKAVEKVANHYPVSNVILFGSRAAGTNREDSDVDLIIEFSVPVSLLTLSMITADLQEILKVDVDVIHGPVRPDDIIEIQHKVLLYAA